MKRYKDLIANLQESEPKQGTVKTHKYSWGTMKTVHHGADFSIPLHPEHHQAISKLKDEQEHKFKDETGRHWVARRKGEHVHFDTTGNGSLKTHVPMHTMHEEYQGEPLTEEDHSELARQAAAEYRKAVARGDSVAANAANAEHIRHKKAAQALRKKSHTPGEIEEAMSPQKQMDFDRMMKGAMSRKDYNAKWKKPLKSDDKVIYGKNVKQVKESDHDPWHDAQENKKSAESAKKQGDHFAYHLHMSDHHSNMAHWSSNRGRYHVANQHQAKAEQHHDWAMQHKNGVRKEELKLQEGKMGQIHADIEDHLGKHLQHYKKVGGAEHFANKVMKTHEHIAKLHGLEKKHAASLVNSYVDSQLKEETLSEEHLVHVSDGSKYGEEPHPKDVEHVMSGAKTHGGEFDGHSDKGAYFKFKSQSDAKNFKRHVDSCPNKTCHADLHESTQIQEGTEIDLDKYFAGIEMKGGEQKKKPAVKKEPENTIKGSQIKFLNTFKEETDINEKLNLAKSKMGDVIKDFQQSDAPQFSGKSKEKRREMAIAAKLEADRQQNEGVIQPSGTDAIDFGVDKPKDTVVRDKKGKLVSFKHEGVWKKSTGTITDKSGAKHGPMSQVRHLARSAMKTVKEELDEAFINGREYASQGVMHPDHAKMHKTGETRDFYAHGTGDKISGKVTKNDGKEVHIQADKLSGGKLHKFTVTPHLPKQQNEQAPVAPVPGQKWKDHAVMVNGRQRVVIHRKNIGNYSKEEGWKEVAPGQKVKEDVDMDGNYVSEPMSYKEFAMMIEGRAQYVVKATHNKTGRVKVSNYVADKDESEYGVRSRAEREHKPMGFSIDSIRRKDIEAHGEGDEEETSSTTKRGRGRPAGSKSGARGPRIK